MNSPSRLSRRPWSTLLPSRSVELALVALVALAAGCKRKGGEAAALASLGTSVARAVANDLRVTPNGKFATYLVDAEKPRLNGIPPQMLVGELHAVPVGGGAPRKLATGVTNVPGGYVVSADGRWVMALAAYNPASQSGDLILVDLEDASGEPQNLGAGVSFMRFSPDSKQLAFVESGVLKAGPVGGALAEIAGEVSSLDYSPDSKLLLFRRRQSAAGGLAVARIGQEEPPRKLCDQVGDFVVSPDSTQIAFTQRSEGGQGTFDLYVASAKQLEPKKVASGTTQFAFSRDSKWLARIEGASLKAGSSGMNFLGDLFVGPAGGGAGRKLGEQVYDFAFSPDSKAVAFSDKYNLEHRVGHISVAELPDGAPKRVALKVKNFSWSPDGKSFAFLALVTSVEFGVSADLFLFRRGQEKAELVQRGVWGYGFSPRGDYLLARSSCTRMGASGAPRACDLMQYDLTQPGAAAKKLLEGIYTFKTSEDGKRVLATYAEIGPDTYDVAVLNLASGARKTIDRHTHLPAYFADDQGSRVVYVVAERARPGVYVSDQVP